MNSAEQRIVEEIDAESESVGRIDIEELRADPEIVKKRADAKIKAILERYGLTYVLTEFSWINGQVQANLDLAEKPKAPLEQ